MSKLLQLLLWPVSRPCHPASPPHPLLLQAFALLLLLLLIAACSHKTSQPTDILGRWQRTSPAGPGGPNELAAEYVEFRPNDLLSLHKDEGTPFPSPTPPH